MQEMYVIFLEMWQLDVVVDFVNKLSNQNFREVGLLVQ